MISIYTLTSPLHDKASVDAATREFLENLEIEYSFKGDNFDDYGRDLSLVFVRTGGTEGIFKEILPSLLTAPSRNFLLLTSGKSNSLAASMEILSYLRQRGIPGEIIHGGPAYVRSRILALEKAFKARRLLGDARLGVVGKPSDWLISSGVDKAAVSDRLGITIEDIPMEELLDRYNAREEEAEDAFKSVEGREEGPLPKVVTDSIPGAYRIYKALRSIIREHGLSGLTIRCFDLLSAVRNTGCLALARLNSEGFVAGCEGDIPAMLSMMIGRAVTGVSGFQANPSSIDPEKGEMVFSHCTVPLDMVDGFGLDTHFESGIGVGIRGHLPAGPVTVFKVNGNLSRHFICEGDLLRCEAKPDLCRTQAVLRLPAEASRYFLTDPIGNHHIILPGHHASELKELLG